MTISHPTPLALASCGSPGANPHSPSTCESCSPPSPRRSQKGSSPQVPTSHPLSGPSPSPCSLLRLWGAFCPLPPRASPGQLTPPSRDPHLKAGLLPPLPGRAPRAPGRPSPGSAPLLAPAQRARLRAHPHRFLPRPCPSGRRGPSERGGVSNGRSSYSGLSPARPPIAAGGGGNIVEWSLDAAATAGWSGAAAGAARLSREGGVRRQRLRRQRREKGRKEGGGRGVLEEEVGSSSSSPLGCGGRRGGGAAPCPRTPQLTAADPPAPGAGEAPGAGAVAGRRRPPWRSSNSATR